MEIVYLLFKLKSDKHIDVELNMGEFAWMVAESKIIYEEIKDYVRVYWIESQQLIYCTDKTEMRYY